MNPSFFLKVFNGKLVLWNYATHEQYELDIDHVHRIVELAAEPGYRANAMDRAIRDSGCLDEIDPPDWGWDCLSRIFHVGTQIRLKEGESLPVDDGYEGYVRYCASIADRMPALVTERPGAVTPLPPPNLDALATVNLRDALMQRESCRNFSAEPLTLQMVSDILWATFGAVHGTTREDMVQAGMMPVGYRRTSPSAGSLQASEAYLVSLRVQDLSAGIYHYRSHTHELSLVREALDDFNLGSLLCAQMFANDLAFGTFVTSRFDKMWWKYPHSRAYRVALLDIGCLTQTFQLCCTALGCQSWPTGYFIDAEVNRLLQLDNVGESAMFFLGAGRGAGPFAKAALAAIHQMQV